MVRMTAEERRESVLRAAVPEFAVGGLAGTSTEAIAGRAGVSQPYLFRLFPSKKTLFLASVERTFALIEAAFREAATGHGGADALAAMAATCSPTGSCCCTSCRPTPPARNTRSVRSRAASGPSGGPSRTYPARPPSRSASGSPWAC